MAEQKIELACDNLKLALCDLLTRGPNENTVVKVYEAMREIKLLFYLLKQRN